MILPLAFDYAKWANDTGTSAVETVIESARGLQDGFAVIGQGVASVFVLFVVIQCATSILEGGKFQIKMLGPLVIYVLACNFSIVSLPAEKFFMALQKESMNAVVDATAKIYDGKSKIEVFYEAYNERNLAQIVELNKRIIEMDNSEAESVNGESTDENSDKGSSFGININNLNPIQNIKNSISKWWNEVKYNFTKSFLRVKTISKNSFLVMILSLGVPFILAVIMDLLVAILTLCMTALGGIMVGVLIVFGPIAWGFAVMPGQTRTISSWFIRLCQFALYAPLCALVNYFSSIIFLNWIGSDAGSIVGLLAVLLCNLVLLTSIPAIAGQIIEGAQGAGISLSNGIQTLLSPMRTFSELSQIAESKRDKEQMSMGQKQLETLKEISQKIGQTAAGVPPVPGVGGGGAGGGSGPNGLNSHRP